MKKGKYAKTTKLSKVLTMVLALVLVAGISVGGTLAWLTATADEVKNTFTVGNITINLTEEFNTDSNDDDVNDKWVGKIVPGNTDVKEPKLTVEAGSEKCYLYACVDNQLAIELEDAQGNKEFAGAININTTNWNKVVANGTKTLYRYKDVIDASTAAVTESVFTQVTYSDLITETNIVELGTKEIIVDGYAHQSDNTDQDTADADAKAHFGFTSTT